MVDFYCHKLKLAIELDSYSHKQTFKYDEQRTKVLNQLGITVIRYNNDLVLNKTEDIFYSLLKIINKRKKELTL
ncbi:DUF559 domain-containing protein [Candidatus Beckwithbacteria bacterium]|nr:DUF559 domain-containing protein [Candidatus Beckwithbacteria bacterium]